jgi:hypothetical protein
VGRWRKFDAFLGPLLAELGLFTAGFDPPASAGIPADPPSAMFGTGPSASLRCAEQ